MVLNVILNKKLCY